MCIRVKQTFGSMRKNIYFLRGHANGVSEMSRLVLVPQLPVKMRYQSWWADEFPKQFQKYFDEVIVLGEPMISARSVGFMADTQEEFSSLTNAIALENVQIQQFLNMKIYDDDRLLLCDISYPGLFSNILYHKRFKHAYAICHGSAKNAYDIFQPVRRPKWKNETAHSKLFKKIFVATEYHNNKLKWKNIEVVGLPKAPFETYKCQKKRNIISVSRPCIQKVNKKIEKKVVRDFGGVYRKKCTSWKDYYKYISGSRVMLITSKEETFGYQVLDAISNNTIPIAPNKYSYPELLPRRYLYENYDELKDCLTKAIQGRLKVPKLKNKKKINNFYKNVTEIMKEGA